MPSFTFPPTIAQLERIAQENQPVLSTNYSTDQDLINVHLLTKVAELEAKLNGFNTEGDSGDVLPPR